MTSKISLKILKLQEEGKIRVEIVKKTKRQKKITKSLKTKNKIVSKGNVPEEVIPLVGQPDQRNKENLMMKKV